MVKDLDFKGLKKNVEKEIIFSLPHGLHLTGSVYFLEGAEGADVPVVRTDTFSYLVRLGSELEIDGVKYRYIGSDEDH